MAKNGFKSRACLDLGREVTRVACGVAYAARGVERGDSAQLRLGLSTVVKFSKGLEELLPAGAKAVRGIRKDAVAIEKSVADAVRKGKRVSRKDSFGMLKKLRAMGKTVEGLFLQGESLCG